MATSSKQFEVGIYEEHLEEASFLCEQRLVLAEDSELGWRDLANYESRLECHIDALVIGEALALEVCRRRVVEGDWGELCAALRVYCRQRRKDLAFEALNTLDGQDAERTWGTALALRQEAPTQWQDDLLRVLQGRQRHLDSVLGHVAGYRRFPAESQLLSKIGSADGAGRRELAWALGRVGADAAIAGLRPLLDDDDRSVRASAALALLRLGDDRPLGIAALAAQIETWPRRSLGIAGPRQAVNVLLDVLRSGKADADGVLALGLLGDLAAVAPLVGALEDEDLGAAAATALNTITGAALAEQVFVVEEIPTDEMFAAEREAYERDGSLPKRPDGEPYGNWEQRALTSPDDWRAWLQVNRQRFDRQRRWRLGQPYGPSALVASLMAPSTPQLVRAASYEELVCRYRLPVPFEADLPVHQQLRFIPKLKQWAAGMEEKFAPGAWYFAGRPQ